MSCTQWGNGDNGRLGTYRTGQEVQWAPHLLQVLTFAPMRHVVAGWRHSVALSHAGRVYTWGCGDHGCLGHNTAQDQRIPTEVQTMASHSSKRIAAGESWTMFVTAEDQVWLCGADVAFGDGNDRYCMPPRARAVSL